MKRLPLLPLAAVLIVFACTDSQLSPPDSTPQFEIYGRSVNDGMGGYNQEVFFDSPLGEPPSGQAGYDAGAFNAFLRPHVRVCELAGDPSMYPAVPDPAIVERALHDHSSWPNQLATARPLLTPSS